MAQTTFFDEVVRWDSLYTAKGFVSNGAIALPVDRYEIESPMLDRVIDHFRQPDKLDPCWLAAVLEPIPEIDWHHQTLVFAVDLARLDDLDQLVLVNAELYKLIDGFLPLEMDHSQRFRHRCDMQHQTQSGLSKVVAVYAYDPDDSEMGDLLGFLGGLRITEDRLEPVRAALAAATKQEVPA